MSSPRTLKEIKQSDKDLLTGYIRSEMTKAILNGTSNGHGTNSNNNNRNNIPDSIITMCLIFYLANEKWDYNSISNGIEITNGAETICKCIEDDAYQMASGINVCKQINNSFHRWTLQLLAYNTSSKIKIWNNVIGVVDTKLVDPIDTDFGDDVDQDGVYFFIGYDLWHQESGIPIDHEHMTYGIPIVYDGDIIEICLDLNQGTLSFIINNINYGVARDDIITDGEYKMFVTINGIGTSFEILSYDNE